MYLDFLESKTIYGEFKKFEKTGDVDKFLNYAFKSLKEPKNIFFITCDAYDWWSFFHDFGFKKMYGNNGYKFAWFRIRLRLKGKDIL